MTEEQGGKNNGVEPVTAEVSNTPLPAEVLTPVTQRTVPHKPGYHPEIINPEDLRNSTSTPISGRLISGEPLGNK